MRSLFWKIPTSEAMPWHLSQQNNMLCPIECAMAKWCQAYTYIFNAYTLSHLMKSCLSIYLLKYMVFYCS